jgi:hypothetical protein
MAHAPIEGCIWCHYRLLQMGSTDVSAIAISANTTHITGILPSRPQHSAKPQLALKRASAEHDTLRVDEKSIARVSFDERSRT